MQKSKEKLESNDYAVGVQYMLHVRHLETHFIERFDPESNLVICLLDQSLVYFDVLLCHTCDIWE